MKRIFFLVSICSLFLVACNSQKIKNFAESGEIFWSEFSGGTEKPSFQFINSKEELHKIIRRNSPNQVPDTDEQPPINIDFPKNSKVILFNFGTFRSGSHRVERIDSIRVKDETLEVFIPKIPQGEMQIQVISQPWMIFSVPKSFQFKNIKTIKR